MFKLIYFDPFYIVAAYYPWYDYILEYESILEERKDHILPLYFEDLKKVM